MEDHELSQMTIVDSMVYGDGRILALIFSDGSSLDIEGQDGEPLRFRRLTLEQAERLAKAKREE